jgi:hypothetical protein
MALEAAFFGGANFPSDLPGLSGAVIAIRMATMPISLGFLFIAGNGERRSSRFRLCSSAPLLGDPLEERLTCRDLATMRPPSAHRPSGLCF